MNSYVFVRLVEGEMGKEAGIWNKAKNLFRRGEDPEFGPMSETGVFRAQSLDNKSPDPYGKMENGVFKDIEPSEVAARQGAASRGSDTSLRGKPFGVEEHGERGAQGFRKGNWGLLQVASRELDEAGRLAPVNYTLPLARKDPEFVDRTVNELEQFTNHIGRTLDPAERESARKVLTEIIADQARADTIRNVGVGAGVAGLGAAGLVAGKLSKSRAARRQLRRRMAIGAGVGGGALTGGAVLHQRDKGD